MGGGGGGGEAPGPAHAGFKRRARAFQYTPRASHENVAPVTGPTVEAYTVICELLYDAIPAATPVTPAALGIVTEAFPAFMTPFRMTNGLNCLAKTTVADP